MTAFLTTYTAHAHVHVHVHVHVHEHVSVPHNIHIACMATQYVCTFRYMYMTLIGMHELHG